MWTTASEDSEEKNVHPVIFSFRIIRKCYKASAGAEARLTLDYRWKIRTWQSTERTAMLHPLLLYTWVILVSVLWWEGWEFQLGSGIATRWWVSQGGFPGAHSLRWRFLCRMILRSALDITPREGRTQDLVGKNVKHWCTVLAQASVDSTGICFDGVTIQPCPTLGGKDWSLYSTSHLMQTTLVIRETLGRHFS